jgi:hypothetical protein
VVRERKKHVTKISPSQPRTDEVAQALTWW